MEIAHVYRHVVIPVMSNFTLLHTFSGQEWQFCQEIDGKTFIFRVNLGMWPLKLIVLKKWALFWGFQHTVMGISEEIDGKTFIFRVNLGMWPLKLIVLKKWVLFWGFQHTFMGISQEIDGKTFIFRVNLGMWPLKSIVLEEVIHCSEGFNTHLWGFWGDRWENAFFFWVNLVFNCHHFVTDHLQEYVQFTIHHV